MNRLLVLFALVLVSACRCGPFLPDPPKQCVGANIGCLSDEQCVDGKCQPLPKCSVDKDCKSPAFQCVLPAQVCALREGFGEQCQEPAAPCDPGNFCALGVCQALATAQRCSIETDCPQGQKCDAVHHFCIEDADCRLADQGFPELKCDTSTHEVCDQLSGHCQLPCQNECTTDAQCQAGGGTNRCNGSCVCVQCLTDGDCGAGLHCDRSGACISNDICRSDADCAPLICDPATAECQAPPPPCATDADCALGDKCDVSTSQCFTPGGPCKDDFLEPSNTPASAHAFDVAPGGTKTVAGLELCPNNDDVYSVALATGDKLTVIVSNTDPHARAGLWLLDSSGETSLAFAETPALGNGTINYVADLDEVVFIRITALIQATSYDIEIDRSTGQVCEADAFDNPNPNNTILTATDLTQLPDGLQMSASICDGDVDFYRAHVNAGEALTANLSFNGTATDLDVAFLNDQGDLIVQSAGTTAPEILRHRFVDPTDVYVRVTGFGNNTGPYQLVVSHDPPFVCTPDAAESDSDVASAVQVAQNQGLGPVQRTMCSGDEDWIVTPLEDFERLIVSTVYQESDVQLQVSVFDATGTTLKLTNTPATGGAAVAYNAQGNETVAVRIRGLNGAAGAYTLSVIKENQNSCAPDILEPNDSVATASALPAPGQLLSMCTSDQDFFVIPGTAGKKVIADAFFRDADADIDLQLLGLDGAQILATADGTSDGEHLEAILPLDGTYSLRVFSITSPAEARYSLSVTEVTP